MTNLPKFPLPKSENSNQTWHCMPLYSKTADKTNEVILSAAITKANEMVCQVL